MLHDQEEDYFTVRTTAQKVGNTTWLALLTKSKFQLGEYIPPTFLNFEQNFSKSFFSVNNSWLN